VGPGPSTNPLATDKSMPEACVGKTGIHKVNRSGWLLGTSYEQAHNSAPVVLTMTTKSGLPKRVIPTPTMTANPGPSPCAPHHITPVRPDPPPGCSRPTRGPLY